jgi:DNA-binding response OmpR family regulator
VPILGTETILLVEDEDAVRFAAARILENAGFRVLPAPNGAEALLIAEQYPDGIDLLLTDVVMPEMSGRELAQKVAGLNGAIKVLFTSGYTDNAIVHHGVLDAGARFIQKPFSSADLTHKVRDVLDET